MAVVPQEAIYQFEALMEEVDESLKRTFQVNPHYVTARQGFPNWILFESKHLYPARCPPYFFYMCKIEPQVVNMPFNTQNVHQGYQHETLTRFLKAREGNVAKAHKMLVDCLNWRVQNEIDEILSKPIVPVELYRGIRDSQLIGMSGYTYEGLPVFAIGVGLSTYDKASVHYYVQSHIQINEYRDRVVLPAATKKHGKHICKCIKVLDMTGLKLSALNQIKLMTIISSIDDLNYPEITQTYYIVNAPYVFSACWKAVKPLLQERTRRKIQVLSGCGQDDFVKIMDYSSLPHFCCKRSSGSSKALETLAESCFSLDYPFHQQLYNYIKQQSYIQHVRPVKHGSIHVTLPEGADEEDIAKTLESELEKIKGLESSPESLQSLKINDS